MFEKTKHSNEYKTFENNSIEKTSKAKKMNKVRIKFQIKVSKYIAVEYFQI